MTIKAKALKYRIRRSAPLAAEVAENADVSSDAGADGDPAAEFRRQPEAESNAGEGAEKQQPNAFADEISAIRREGLTGRQLRMARRLAQKNGLAPTSDFDAVRLLRERGIDPFQRTNMLELVVENDEGSSKQGPGVPQAVATPMAQPPAMADDHRVYQVRAVREIQREIAQRRRARLATLLARLSVFVLLPTFITGWYFYAMATPMYATKSEFLIQQSDVAGSSAMGGLFSGTSFATSQDSIVVQSYLESRDAMLRLDQDIGFKSHFSQEEIDPLQRLDPDASNEKAYKLYKKQVTIGYDPTEGIVKMEVVAADPEVSVAYSRALISYAEEQVDDLTLRLRGDQMLGARDSFDEAEAKMLSAQARVLDLQERLGVLDPNTESAALLGQINRFETELREKRLELQQLQDNRRPNQARVAGVEGDIKRLEALVADLRSQLTGATDTRDSLASMSSQLRLAEIELQTRTTMMQQALQQMETARIEANRQVRYLSLGVSPVAPDAATYPKSFINTLLAFLIFSGIYLMASLTVSILREQVSS